MSKISSYNLSNREINLVIDCLEIFIVHEQGLILEPSELIDLEFIIKAMRARRDGKLD